MKINFEPSCPGNRIKIEYRPIVSEDGKIELVEDGKIDLQDFYNSQASQCDLHIIIARYLNGDPFALDRVQGSYFDATEFPKTYAEMLQRVIDGKRLFEALPVDIRKEFNNDFNQFFAASNTDKFGEILAKYTKKVSDKDNSEKEVNKEN